MGCPAALFPSGNSDTNCFRFFANKEIHAPSDP
jgi:hypothetical protein